MSEWTPDIERAFREPFDPNDIEWKKGPWDRDKKEHVYLAYVEDRRYMDRLDEVVGARNWQNEMSISERDGHIQLKCWLTILGVTKCSTGEAPLAFAGKNGENQKPNDNALTTAESQAFKRACTRFGIGRYLYDIPRSVQRTEDLPDWAIPHYTCTSCGKEIKGEGQITAGQIRKRSLQKFGEALCIECAKAKATS